MRYTYWWANAQKSVQHWVYVGAFDVPKFNASIQEGMRVRAGLPTPIHLVMDYCALTAVPADVVRFMMVGVNMFNEYDGRRMVVIDSKPLLNLYAIFQYTFPKQAAPLEVVRTIREAYTLLGEPPPPFA